MNGNPLILVDVTAAKSILNVEARSPIEFLSDLLSHILIVHDKLPHIKILVQRLLIKGAPPRLRHVVQSLLVGEEEGKVLILRHKSL